MKSVLHVTEELSKKNYSIASLIFFYLVLLKIKQMLNILYSQHIYKMKFLNNQKMLKS